MEILKMIKKGKDFNNTMIKEGHMEIVKLMIEKGANDINVAMNEAIKEEHIEIVKYLEKLI
jgi:ankyrin repeat protein